MFEESNHPKISVLIPVYNVEKYVRRCLFSVLNQTMQEGVEVIIVNDCTPDHSMEEIFEALRAYSGNERGEKMSVRVVNHDTKHGQAVVRNTAMNYATGDYVIHVDSDDWIEPDMLEKLYACAMDTKADIVCCNISLEYKSRQENLCYPYKEEQYKDLLYIDVLRCSVWNKLIKRNLYVNNKISFFPGLNMWEDVSVTCRLRYFSQRTVVVPEALYHYNKQNTSSTVSQLSRRNIDEQIRCASILEDFFKKQGKSEDTEFALIVLYIKFESKRGLIWNAANRDVKAWKATYPETNKCIWSYKALSKSIRLTLILAAIGFPKLACWLIDWNHKRRMRDLL